ncbi:cytoskeleton-associated protein 2-like isoform X1 [Ruditapes philippinarum]|uniref:cytoskeleton-associated protein 2-like isoform X1 n=1 Tax=Ruditapes philippinarum TaxID=129788 RepID=UPI00295B44C0|nr:cytoskeleton-associated protein 2-like isoform X1 [Ruditapes philippinarum]
MEKTKAELYLEKVQKWREQRIKEKEERQKIKQKSVSKKETTLPVIVKAGQVKASQVKQSPVKATIKPCVKTVKPCVTTIERPKQSCKSTDTQIKTGIFGTKTKVPKVAAKVEKRRKSEETRQLMEKLNKWREEKKSAKKIIQKNTTVKGKEVPMSHVQAGCKVVRSRLFDYQSKPKQQSSTDKRQVNKENKFVSKPTTHKTEISKTGVKRRFSEVQKVNKGQQKPVGILKRKSCIGSFDLTDKNDGRSPAKRRRTSVSNTDNNNTIDNNDDVFVGNVSPSQTESDTTCKQLPISVVTPGVSTRNVRFSTPQNNHSHTDGKELRKTPKTPATRSEELKDWLKAKGKTPSKFRHLMCFHGKKPDDEKSEDPHTKNMLTVQELSEQMDVLEQERLQLEAEKKMNSMLDECMILFEAGCPMEAIVPWLDDIYKQIPFAQNSARFYTCKANVIKSSLDLDAVLEIFEQATINNAQV